MKTRAGQESGFTLVELLVTMSILVVIVGITYTSFSRALTLYQTDTKELALAQNLRIGLSAITRDASNAIISQGNTNLSFDFDDAPGELPDEGLDLISFVTAVVPLTDEDAGEATSDLAPSRRTALRSQLAEEDDEVPTDVVRVAYVIGPDPDAASTSMATATQTASQTALLRVTSRTLDMDDAFEDAFRQSDLSMLDTLEQLGATVTVVVANARSLNFAFYNGEEWLTDWDFEEDGAPRAMRVVLTVQEPNGGALTYSRSSTAVVSTTPSEGSGQGNAAGQPGGGAQPGGTPGGGEQQGGPAGGSPQQG